MILIKQYAEWASFMESGIPVFDKVFSEKVCEAIERAGRTAYQSEPKGDPEGFVRMILKRGHLSVLEHVNLTARLVTDRGVLAELTRHRLAAYTVESTRYVDYAGDKQGNHCKFIIPTWLETEVEEGEYHSAPEYVQEPHWYFKEKGKYVCPHGDASWWMSFMAQAENAYQSLRGVCNWVPQQARSVLPNSTKTEIVMTANLREWLHVFKLRCAKDAHPQMVALMTPLRDKLFEAMPVLEHAGTRVL